MKNKTQTAKIKTCYPQTEFSRNKIKKGNLSSGKIEFLYTNKTSQRLIPLSSIQ